MAFDFANFRAGNIASNAELANDTGLTEATTTITKARPTPRTTSTGKKIGRPKGSTATASENAKKRKIEEEFIPRKSTRSRAAKATNQEERDAIIEQNVKEEAERKEQERQLKHLPKQLEALKGVNGSKDDASFKEIIKELADFTLAKEDENDGWKLGERPGYEEGVLESMIGDMSLRSIVRVVPERIYSLAVHPDTTKDLVFAGDKIGHVGLWDATNAGKIPEPSTSIRGVKKEEEGAADEDDGEEGATGEPSQGKHWLWKAHNKGSVSCLKFRPHDTKRIYSACYDRTLRVHDFETGMSTEVIDADDDNFDGLLHSFDFDPTGNELWTTDGDGGLHWRDLREPITQVKRWQIDKSKVGCISINPARPSLAATAHLKRDMRLWDLNKLRGLSTDSSTEEIANQAMIVAYLHGKACSSSYFDPSGTRLLSTSYDDCLRVWDIDPFKAEEQVEQGFEPNEIFSHNCQVGRFVTVLRAFWSTLPPSIAPPHIHVGNMRRALDVFHPNGTKAKCFQNELISAVPAVTANHPSLPDKYFGGSASGKIAYFAKPL
ncbi:Cmr1p [Sporobolomyces koalae]|uniref:Cmr1p n=1 Tax=Sporobolomyces koalae TaxID=500713 RepID=UPI003182854F